MTSRRFDAEIRPILVEHCYGCHGPGRQEGGLRFDRYESVFRRESPIVVPGNPIRSSLMARVTSDDPHWRMPYNGDRLSDEEIDRLRRWISDGAPWPDDLRHWSFVKPARPPVPNVRDTEWPIHPIDRFILARLESEQLEPSPQLERTTLMRRLSLDLLGLPPALTDVDDFLSDSSPDAADRLADRLLASPHFGEKWAIRWLDLARYADSNGFEFDAVRSMWLYRDWVIASLNHDVPFDQFTVEQLAGDLLPKPSPQQLVATGFMRCSAVAPDVATHRFDVMADRVNTLGATWLGLTFGCAQCHDHKFDPLTQKEYYQLFAIFNQDDEEVQGNNYVGRDVTTASLISGQRGTTLVLGQRIEPLTTYLKVRGSPFVDGEPVEPGLPGFLHEARCGGSDRLGLACWLIDDDNPLTGRVIVNRLWESLFGAGIVRTSDDFGTRGERPSHPELLDWLAIDFRRFEGSLKRMIRQIVSTATYRQSAQCRPELLEKDPQNRLLARGPRFRLDAEVIRDVALAASGLLSDRLGGPSVFPPQPAGTSEKLEFAGFAWPTNQDDNRYRRGLYTHWKRTALYPSFSLFDAPNRTATCTRRNVSTTPLQALVTLNDPVFFEAAVHLARRMLDGSEGGDKPSSANNDARTTGEDAIRTGFRLCLSRHPADDEVAELSRLLEEERRRLASDPETAVRQLGGEAIVRQFPRLNEVDWAACSTLANVLLNLDETITRE